MHQELAKISNQKLNWDTHHSDVDVEGEDKFAYGAIFKAELINSRLCVYVAVRTVVC